ncbi:S41 family peptidase [Zavarzinella formosa]|uniref:S41 family peptidase n=1 Tax=Zavarzinella formosa TaxID=360055 RepID=UPI0002F149DB|nr:S41 family peptidase [Zavarzinella formosa]
MSRFNLGFLLAVPLMMLAGLGLSFSAPNKDREREYKLIRTVVDVLAEVDQHFVKPLDDKGREKLVEDMINGGLERLDPYSQYMNPEELKQFNAHTEGNFGGVGINLGVDPKTGLLMVISPMVGTPAHEAGILAGDVITKIQDQATDTMKMADAIKLIQGEPGTTLTMTVFHEGAKQADTYTLTRAMIEVPSVLGLNRKPENPKEWDWYADSSSKIAYIRVVQFSEHTTEDLKKAVQRLDSEGAKAIVLDLRDNPGGLLTSAVSVSDMFLNSGRIVSTKDRNGNGKAWDAKAGDTLFEPADKKPIAVLLNKNSASASEIVAAALQDNKRAVIVGERSFGKGSVQKIIRLQGDPPAALKLTTDTYWRPSGANIHRHPDSKDTDEWGVKPDAGLEVVLKDEERLEYLRAKRNKDIIRKDMKPKEGEKPAVDRVLDTAVAHLKKELAK